MRALKQLILTIAIIFVMVGCSDDIIENRIAKADELLDDYPDSAMTCLKSLSSKDIVTGRDKALYSVVSTMANLKLGNDTVEDKILSDACEYYADEDEPSRGKMLTHFAKAALLSAKDDDINALTEYEKAIRYSSGKNADRYRALSYFNMSAIYTRAYSYPDVKECIEEGMKYMLMSNDTSTMIHGYLVAGMSYNNDGNHAKALELLEKGVGLALKKQDNEMANRLRLQIAYTQSMLNNHREASEIFDSLLYNSDCSLSPADFYTYVNSLSFSGKTEKAENILNSLDSSFIVESRPHWVFSQSIIASEQGNFKEAYKLLSGTMDYQNTVVNDKLNTSFVREQKKLAIANEKMQMQIAENRKKMLTLICCISALTVVSAIILIIYIIKRNKLKSEKSKYLHKHQLSEMKVNITELTVKIRETERAHSVIASNLKEVEKLLADNEEERLALKNEKEAMKRNIEEYDHKVCSMRLHLISNFRQLHNSAASFCNNIPHGVSTPAAIKMYEVQRREILAKYRSQVLLSDKNRGLLICAC